MTPTSPNSATSNDATNPATTTKASHPVASVSLGSVRSNFKALKAFAGGAECSAVVKADAYGHGMTEVANALLQEGCATFFVAYASEGMQLRHVVGSEPKIYVFHGALSMTQNELDQAEVRPRLISLPFPPLFPPHSLPLSLSYSLSLPPLLVTPHYPSLFCSPFFAK